MAFKLEAVSGTFQLILFSVMPSKECGLMRALDHTTIGKLANPKVFMGQKAFPINWIKFGN
jgi:hypothetical protein